MKKNYNIKIEEEMKEKSEIGVFSYQQDAIRNLEKLNEEYPDYYSTLVVVPTGGGKTRIAVEYLYKNAINVKKHKVLWIAERILLLKQTYQAFVKLANRTYLPDKAESGIITRLISSEHEEFENTDFHNNVDLVIITQQTLEKKIDRDLKIINAMRKWLEGAECLTIVIDEAHHAIAEPYKAILMSLLMIRKEYKFNCHIIGLTATPKKESSNKIEKIEEIFSFGVYEGKEGLEATSEVSYAYRISIHDLVSKRVLSIPYMVQIKDWKDKDEMILYTYLGGASCLPIYDGQIGIRENIKVGEVLAPESFGQTILFAEDRIHALKLERKFKEAGVKCGLAISIDKKFGENFSKKNIGEDSIESYLGKSIVKKRQQIKDDIEEYRKGNLQLIITVDMLLEGVDFPKTQSVFIAREKTDDVMITQMVGRALRGEHQDGTPTALIVSFGEKKLEKILWEVPDSYEKERKYKELSEEFKLSKIPKVDYIEPFLLKADNFKEGQVSQAERDQILFVENTSNISDKQIENIDREKIMIRSVISSEVVILPKGYYRLGKGALLVWGGMDSWIEEIRKRIEKIVENAKKHSLDEEKLRRLDSFEEVAGIIISTIPECEVWEREERKRDHFLKHDIVERYIWHLIRYYMLQCGESTDTFLKETKYHEFSHLEQYDLSGILKESIERNVNVNEFDSFMDEMWECKTEVMSEVWHDKETFIRFLKPKLYRLHNIPVEQDDEDDEDDDDYFRVRLYREGRKRGKLCEMLKQIIRYKPNTCKQLVDVFGGTGTVIAQMNGMFASRVYNDFDVNLANFVYIVSDSDMGEGFDKFCHDRVIALNASLNLNKDKLIAEGKHDIVQLLEELGLLDRDILKTYGLEELENAIHKKICNLECNAKKKIDNKEVYNSDVSKYKKLKNRFKKNRNSLNKKRAYILRRYKELTKQIAMLKDDKIEEKIKLYIAFYYKVERELKELNNKPMNREYIDKINRQIQQETDLQSLTYNDMKKRAFCFLFSRSFPSNKMSGESITGVDGNGIKQFDKHINWKEGTSWLTEFHGRMRGVEVWCKDFREILKKYETANTVYYLDPPYFLTCQYDAKFSDGFHIEMLEWLRNTKCKWVLSCKDKVTNLLEAVNWKDRIGNDKKIIYVDNSGKEDKSLKQYFGGFLYPMIETEVENSYLELLRCKDREDAKFYKADIQPEKKRKDSLYVYKLSDEKYAEVMISNIEVKKSDRVIFKDNGIFVEEFEKYFKLKHNMVFY